MANRKLSRIELIKINELLKLHLVPAEADGYWRYQGEWSDAKIAFEIALDIQATTIGNARLELFGKLATSANMVRDDNGRYKELETLVQNILSCYGELEVKYNKLIDTLALNKVANVAHLKTTVKETKNV